MAWSRPLLVIVPRGAGSPGAGSWRMHRHSSTCRSSAQGSYQRGSARGERPGVHSIARRIQLLERKDPVRLKRYARDEEEK
jgi:hypothetical protein